MLLVYPADNVDIMDVVLMANSQNLRNFLFLIVILEIDFTVINHISFC